MGARGRLILGIVILAALLPPVAMAGKRVVVRQQSLQIKVGLSSTKAGARPSALRLHVAYKNPKHPAQQPPYNSKSIIFFEPKGAVLHPNDAPACKQSALVKTDGSVNVCPAGSKVGSGSVVVNAAPTVPKPITGALTIYNGIDDGGYGGYRRGSRELILYVKTSIGINTTLVFHLVKTPGGVYKLVSHLTKPPKPGVTPGSFSLQTLNLILTGAGHKPFLTNPGTCTGSWTYSLTIINYFRQPSITAQDQVRCRR
jgi:hypothetical protein